MGNAPVTGDAGGKRLQRCRGGWVLCLDEGQSEKFEVKPVAGRSAVQQRVQDLTHELFTLQDLNKNGFLGENELIKLNEKIAMLHYGPDTDLNEVKSKFSALFREKLDKDGKPVEFETYRGYLQNVLQELDRDPRAHEMILEQWIAEAESARAAFSIPAMRSDSDAEFYPHLDLPIGEIWLDSTKTLPPVGMEAPLLDPSRSGPTTIAAMAQAISADSPTGRARRAAMPPPFSAASSFGYPPPGTSRGSSFMPRSPPHSARPFSPSSPSGGAVPHPGFFLNGGGAAAAPSFASSGMRGPAPRSPRQGYCGPPLATPLSGGSQASSVMLRENTMRCDSMGSSIPEPQSPVGGVFGFVPGMRIQVWSNSKRTWMDGVVEDVFPAPCLREGFQVPAGTVKVASSAGIKWVQPGEVERLLRRFSGHGSAVEMVIQPPFTEGDAVEVWSDSKHAWLPGSVLEAYATTSGIDGLVVPAGTVKVCSEAGIKWVLQENAASVLREPAKPQTPTRGSASYTKGERVRVWSDRRKAWVGGVVREVVAHQSGPSIPPGTLKVVCGSGAHWFQPQDVARFIRKADGGDLETSRLESKESSRFGGALLRMIGPPSASFTIPPIASFSMESAATEGKIPTDLKGRVAEALKDPKKLQRRTSRVWAAFGCDDSGGLGKESVAGALEALAQQFGVRLELEGRHLLRINNRFDTLASSSGGRISFADFQEFSRQAIGEVYQLL